MSFVVLMGHIIHDSREQIRKLLADERAAAAKTKSRVARRESRVLVSLGEIQIVNGSNTGATLAHNLFETQQTRNIHK